MCVMSSCVTVLLIVLARCPRKTCKLFFVRWEKKEANPGSRIESMYRYNTPVNTCINTERERERDRDTRIHTERRSPLQNEARKKKIVSICYCLALDEKKKEKYKTKVVYDV